MWENARRFAAYVSGEDSVVESPSPSKLENGAEAGPSTTTTSYDKRKVLMPREWSESQREKLLKILNKSVVDIDQLQQVSWGGIPQDLRPICWQLMLGYLPRETSSWQDVVNCKRKAYRDLLKTHYEVSNSRKR